MPDERPRLSVAGGVAAIDRLDDEALSGALRTVPGKATADGQTAWVLRIGPERAHAVARIAEHFGLARDAGTDAALDLLVAARDTTDPVIELIADPEGRWLTLADDWGSFGIEALRAVPGSRRQPIVGRTEVPITAWTRQTIVDAIAAHSLRLSPGAQAALTADTAPQTEVEPSTSARITMDPGGGHITLAAGDDPDLARAFALLPSARGFGGGATGTRRWMISPTPETARALRALTPTHPDIAVDPASATWLDDAPRWIARATLEVPGDAEPRFVLTTRWGEPPDALSGLQGATTALDRTRAPLTIANARALAELLDDEQELQADPAVERTVDWVRAHADATAIPAGELDVVTDVGGVTRLVAEPIWDAGVEAAFFQQEAHILKRHRLDHPGASSLPTDAWPPDDLARLIRIRRLSCSPSASALVQGAALEDADTERLVAMSQAEDADVHIEGLAGELMPFQRAGVAYALERRRLFVADEQGLGKTIQALATIQADSAFPAVIVCPASLKLNWIREASAWLPQRSAVAVSGRKSTAEIATADIVVLNYEIVAAHVEALDVIGPRALILDESHYVKSATANRTQAVLELAQRLPPDALRLALTGTPVVNRPAELAPQLRVLGRLAEYGSARSFERGYTTPAARRHLHHRLRSSCYLRRRKADVLTQLPDKRRAVVTVPLDNKAEYERAEQDFVRWLAEQIALTGSGRLPENARGAALVRLTALRRLAARGKLAAAIQWIADFGASEEGLVVFAHHRDIQDAVVARFPGCARILGGDDPEERERNVRAFQSEAAGDDAPTLCVCSLEVASLGFTLTAAANVAFLELAWTPAKHDQAEDRVHRIGQTRGVTAWYLLAADTIDERIATLLEDKRAVVGSITDGGEETGGSLVSELISGYAPATR